MSIDSTLLEDASSSHRIYIGDSIGCLRVAQCDPPSALPKDYAGPSVKPLILPNFKSHSDHAVQRIASGVLGSDVYVVALARKNATIDVVHIANQSLPSTSTAPAPVSELRANIICTIQEPLMKAGIHRFVGLALSKHGVFTITSSGVLRYTPIAVTADHTPPVIEVREAKVLDHLPSPLQHASFYPAFDPTHFCYGGEDIPLSLWHIPTALSEQPTDSVADMSVESFKTEDVSELNSKQRKRKRQLEAKSKARELLWGEVWRAKNLANDNLSLPRRANITCTCILNLRDSTAQDGETGAVDETTFIAVGTKDGLVRVFQPGAGSRRHIREMRVIATGQGAVKTLCASSAALDGRRGGLLFVGDTGCKVYAVDWQSGKVVYGYKDGQVGATLCMVLLPGSVKCSNNEPEALVTVSSDSLVRLQSTVPAALAVPKAGASAEKGEVLWTKMIAPSTSHSVHATPTAVVWDGVLPPALNKRTFNSRENTPEDDDDDEQDEVWASMQAVGEKRHNGRNARKNAKPNGNVQDDHVDNDDTEEEDDTDQEHGADPEARSAQIEVGKEQVKRRATHPAQPKRSRN